MSKEIGAIQEVKLEDLKPFSLHSSQTYQGERLEQLMSSIERSGMMNPIIVRPIDDNKYEIICGHNRVLAMKELGRDVIRADVRTELSDDEAVELFYDSNLNQQSFNDWNYTQKIKAIQYTEKMIKENSQQGRRNDIAENEATKDGTCVQSRHKLGEGSRRSTTRDRMARRLGISTATLSKYRSIVKLSDKQIETIAHLLDEKIITFEVAFTMSRVELEDFEMLVEELEQSPDNKIDPHKLKSFIQREKEPDKSPTLKEQIQKLFVPRNPNKEADKQKMTPIRRPKPSSD